VVIKMEMTPRERVLTAMRRKIPDRVPKWIDYESFAPGLMEVFKRKTGAESPAEYFDYDLRFVSFKPTQRRTGLEKYIPANLPEKARIDWNWGNILISGEHKNVAQTWHYALAEAETEADIEEYPLPDFLEEYRWGHIRRDVEQYHKREYAVMGFMSQTLFEVSWGVRGFEDFLVDMMLNKGMVRILLDRITEMRCRQARIFAEAGVDILRLGDDVGTERGMMISRASFCEWLKPRFKKIIDEARKINPDILVFYHSDGNCLDIIPDLIEIGINILNPIQPECMDPAEVKRLYGDRLAFIGTIGTQTTMPFGTVEDVEKEVKLRIETVGKGGGLLLGPTHLLQDEVPWENVIALFEAVEKYGKY
jgi:uroporphyrinogen decarboxylase